VYVDVPLIIKLNAKTSIPEIYPIATQICTVERAIKLGASAVAYTIYDGSPTEPEEFREFGKIVEQAHDYGIPIIAYMYPRGPTVKDELDPEILAYSARVGLELGADFVKMKYNNSVDTFSWVVKCAGRTKVLVTADYKTDSEYLLRRTADILRTGAAGIVVGPPVWKDNQPYSLSKALHAVVFEKAAPDQAMRHLR
jgi:class I fructose-bisphosphate aldolase